MTGELKNAISLKKSRSHVQISALPKFKEVWIKVGGGQQMGPRD